MRRTRCRSCRRMWFRRRRPARPTPASMSSAADDVASKTTEPLARAAGDNAPCPPTGRESSASSRSARQTAAAAWQRAATNGNCLRGAGGRHPNTKIASNCGLGGIDASAGAFGRSVRRGAVRACALRRLRRGRHVLSTMCCREAPIEKPSALFAAALSPKDARCGLVVVNFYAPFQR